MKKIFAALLSAAVLLTASSAMAADGAALYTAKTCHTCHGPAGKKPIMPQYPALAGQSAQYLEQQIKDIKAGKRANGMSMVMKANPMVLGLKDDEIKAISEYLAAQK